MERLKQSQRLWNPSFEYGKREGWDECWSLGHRNSGRCNNAILNTFLSFSFLCFYSILFIITGESFSLFHWKKSEILRWIVTASRWSMDALPFVITTKAVLAVLLLFLHYVSFHLHFWIQKFFLSWQNHSFNFTKMNLGFSIWLPQTRADEYCLFCHCHTIPPNHVYFFRLFFFFV